MDSIPESKRYLYRNANFVLIVTLSKLYMREETIMYLKLELI